MSALADAEKIGEWALYNIDALIALKGSSPLIDQMVEHLSQMAYAFEEDEYREEIVLAETHAKFFDSVFSAMDEAAWDVHACTGERMELGVTNAEECISSVPRRD